MRLTRQAAPRESHGAGWSQAPVCGINSSQSDLSTTADAFVRLLGSINFENSLQVDIMRVNLLLPQGGGQGSGGGRWFGLLQLALATAGLKRRALCSRATRSTHAADDGLPTHLCVGHTPARCGEAAPLGAYFFCTHFMLPLFDEHLTSL